MTPEEKLKPCPFCGNKTVHFAYDINGEPHGITCCTCHILVKYMRIHVKGGEWFEVSMDKMADEWNRREV